MCTGIFFQRGTKGRGNSWFRMMLVVENSPQNQQANSSHNQKRYQKQSQKRLHEKQQYWNCLCCVALLSLLGGGNDLHVTLSAASNPPIPKVPWTIWWTCFERSKAHSTAFLVQMSINPRETAVNRPPPTSSQSMQRWNLGLSNISGHRESCSTPYRARAHGVMLRVGANHETAQSQLTLLGDPSTNTTY